MSVVAVFYVVLGSHALLFGGWLLALTPSAAPSLPFAELLLREPGLVRAYGAALLATAVPFFATGVALLRGRWWARWSTAACAPLHIVGPPFLLGGVVFALAVNLYLFGSAGVRSYFEALRPRPAPQP